jgi:carboxyl-terminal processing protease
MRRLSFILFLLISNLIFSQTGSVRNEKTQKFIDEVSDIISKNSLFKDSLNWEKISKEINELPLDKNDSVNRRLLIRFFTDKLREVGDKHSFFLTKRGASNMASKPHPIPVGMYMNHDIGWIKVPSCMNVDESKNIDFANAIRKEIKKIDSSNAVKGWIVDLRHNGGGNMWPMLAGLNALIDDDTVGYFIYPSGNKVPWISKNGEMKHRKNSTGNRNDGIDSYKIKNTNAKIAVLIDSKTGSSGEMTAISLIGLPNVKVFGQPSGGLTTANGTYDLSDGTKLNLANAWAADRTGKKYFGKIIPDNVIENLMESDIDETLEAACSWLLLSR